MAIISPIIPIVKMLPILERSRLVVVPITAIAPKVPAVIRKVLAIDAPLLPPNLLKYDLLQQKRPYFTVKNNLFFN